VSLELSPSVFYYKGGFMSRALLIIFSLIFNLLQAELRVEKVLETTTVKAYNQWIKANKENFPELKPTFIQVEDSVINDRRTIKIFYYNEDGEIVNKEEILRKPSSGFINLRIPKEGDRIIFEVHDEIPGKERFAAQVVVKDKIGRELFSLNNVYTLLYIETGVYIEEFPLASCALGVGARIYNEEGQQIGLLRNIGEGIELNSIKVPEDKRYAVFSFIGNNSSELVLIDKKGREIWRKKFTNVSHVPTFISKDGSYIGINYKDRVFLYNEKGTLLKEYSPFGNTELTLKNSLSSDGRFLVTGLESKIFLYDNQDCKQLWQKEISESLSVKSVDFTNDSKYVIVGCKPHVILIADINGNIIKTLNLALGETLAHRKTGTGEILRFKTPVQDWTCETRNNLILVRSGMKCIFYKIGGE
jgi:hypothetical protein